MISASYRRVGPAREARITRSPGLPGELAWRGATRTLRAAEKPFRME
jgi:hypothetical protein